MVCNYVKYEVCLLKYAVAAALKKKLYSDLILNLTNSSVVVPQCPD